MTLTRREIDRPIPLTTAMQRLFGDWPLIAADGSLELGPPIDVEENENAYVVTIDLPGVEPRDTEVLIEGRTLTIRGRTATESEKKTGKYLVRERRKGEFMRAVALPGMVEVDQVTSNFENGQLTITLPKAVQNRARRIEISTGNGSRERANPAKGGSAKAAGSAAERGSGS